LQYGRVLADAGKNVSVTNKITSTNEFGFLVLFVGFQVWHIKPHPQSPAWAVFASLQLRNIRTAVNLNGPKTASGSDRQDFHPPVESHIIPPITAQKKCLAQVRGLVNSSPVLYRSLVGGLEHGFYDFPYIGNVIIPTDELHHFSEG
jgi:hypothetical protein